MVKNLKSQELQVSHQIIEFAPTQPPSERRHVAASLANDSASLGFCVFVRSFQIAAQRSSEGLSSGAAMATETILLENHGSGMWRTMMAAAKTGAKHENNWKPVRFHGIYFASGNSPYTSTSRFAPTYTLPFTTSGMLNRNVRPPRSREALCSEV